MTGETPFQFLTRIRVEKAAALLAAKSHVQVSEIAFQCGFSSLSLFSRTFRNHFGMSPGKWREAINEKRETRNERGEGKTDTLRKDRCNLSKTLRNKGQTVSNEAQAGAGSSMYICPETKTLKWRTTMKLNKSMEVKNLPKMTVAYIRHTGPYQGNDKLFQNLTEELCRWAGPRGLLGHPTAKILAVYHDDPKVTEQDKLRLSMCLTVPENTKVDGRIGKMEIAEGAYAVGRFEVNSQEFGEAWDWLYGSWLPQSGYQPDDGPCFEVYPEEPKAGEKIKVDICVPVKPL